EHAGGPAARNLHRPGARTAWPGRQDNQSEHHRSSEVGCGRFGFADPEIQGVTLATGIAFAPLVPNACRTHAAFPFVRAGTLQGVPLFCVRVTDIQSVRQWFVIPTDVLLPITLCCVTL